MATDKLLLETGDYVLLETGDKILLEQDVQDEPDVGPDLLEIIGTTDDDTVVIVGSSYAADGDTVVIETLSDGDFAIAFAGNSKDRRRIIGYLETEQRRLHKHGG